MFRRCVVATVAALVGSVGVSHADTGSVPDTAYTGHYFQVKPAEAFRKCVAWRESRNSTRAVSRGGHRGLYQLTPALGDGAAWMMRMDPVDPITRAQRVRLQSMPVTSWSRYWQDRAFYTVLNARYPLSGARHWFLSGSACNGHGGL
jgi:hypothetical protein